jgi:hypothetical protein
MRSCLIERTAPRATLLSASAQWEGVYSDQMIALFVRSEGAVPKSEK